MNIAVACGGTGGHIFPGLATAQVLRDRGHDVTLWLAGKRVEQSAVAGWRGAIVTIPSEGPRKILSVLRSFLIMRSQKPDVVLAMGGFGSVGPCLAARLLGIPYVLHESNAIPGRAIRFLSKEAAAVAVGLECARAQIRCRTIVWTGIPVRQEILRVASQREAPGFCLLVIGGSGGAHAINEIVSTAVCKLPQSDLSVIHLTGTNDEQFVNRRYADAGVSADVRAFEQNIAALYAEADFVICRAGASTCAEIAAMDLPALMIPLPWAADNHQLANAKAFSDDGMMDFIMESECTVDGLIEYLQDKINHQNPKQCSGCVIAETAAERLAKLVQRV